MLHGLHMLAAITDGEADMTEVMYLGRRMTGKGAVAITLITVENYKSATEKNNGLYTADNIENASSLFDAKKMASMTIGGVYDFDCEVNDVGRIKTIKSQPKFIRFFDAPQRSDWNALDHQVIVEKQRALNEKKAKKLGSVERAIQTLKAARQSAAPSQRSSFTAWMISELMR